jgi:hypothetical protein
LQSAGRIRRPGTSSLQLAHEAVSEGVGDSISFCAILRHASARAPANTRSLFFALFFVAIIFKAVMMA